MESTPRIARRQLVAAMALVPVALALGQGASATAPAVCYDPASLSLAQKRQRRSIGYVEPSSDPAKRCGGCAFFKPAAAAGCGTCDLLSAGPVQAAALCNSYAPRPAP